MALLAVVLIAPVWSAVLAGLVELRACLPGGSPIVTAHLVLIRPDADCPSGLALADGAFAVIGTIGLLSLLGWVFAGALLAWAGALVARGRVLVRQLLDAVVPGRRVRPVAVVPGRVRWTAVISERFQEALALAGHVSRRGPPLPA